MRQNVQIGQIGQNVAKIKQVRQIEQEYLVEQEEQKRPTKDEGDK